MKISIVIPVYNEEVFIASCLEALISQNYPKKDYEIVVVNDGSTDSTLKTIEKEEKRAKKLGVSLRCISLKKNSGRIIARETGAKKAKFDNLLFIDARCQADKNLLKAIKEINYQPLAGNPVIDTQKSISDYFNWMFRKKLYAPYFGENFEPVYINKNNFDKIPKGTGVFFCNRELFLSSVLKEKSKDVSDDTKLLFNIVQKKDILRHPAPKVTYISRNSFKSVISHTYNRGPKFVDYYLDQKKKYFWLFIFFPIAALIFTITLFFINFTYFSYCLGFLILIWIIVSIWLAENIKGFFIIFSLLPIVGFSFELGILKGLIFKLLKKY